MKRLIIKPACAGATRRAAAVSVMAGRHISMAKDGSALRKLISRVKATEAGGIRTRSVILWLAALRRSCPEGPETAIGIERSRRRQGSLLADDAATDSPDLAEVICVQTAPSPLLFLSPP